MDLPLPSRDEALAQPAAARLFDALTEAKHPLTTSEAAKVAGVHPNTARKHLGHLADAGLVESGSDPGPRGRPRKIWRVGKDARIAGQPPEAYQELAGWLGRSVAVLAADPGEIRAQGRRIGREIAEDAGSGDGTGVLEDSLRAMGFWPQRKQREDGTRFTLCNCPYRDVAKSNISVICTLHLGIAEGIVSGAEAGARVVGFEPKDACLAGCTIDVDATWHESEGGPRMRPRDPSVDET
ncbi:MAG: helix-turn-helix domain-containing protein [Solirubrobacterales bacterium]